MIEGVIMKSFYKYLGMLFICFVFGFITLLLVFNRNYATYVSYTMRGAVKLLISYDDNKIEGLPSKTSIFCAQMKLLWNLDKKMQNEFFSENIANFKIFFKSYNELLFLFNEIFGQKCYFFKTDNKTPYIIDCGGNIGMSVLFFKSIYKDSKILVFEPCKGNMDFLRRNVLENKLTDVVLEQKALADKLGTLCLYNSESLRGSILKERNGEATQDGEQVQVIKLSDYIDREVDMLKVDIEGAESMVFQDLLDSGKLKFIKQTIIECHTDKNLVHLLNIFEKNDFYFRIKSDLRTPFSKEQGTEYLIYAYK